MARDNRKLAIVAALAAGVLLLAACSSDEDEAPPKAAPEPSPTPNATCPLTGEDPPKGLDLTRPAVAIKIENSPQARPQSGLEHADLVFEEIVEGGITRFMAIYHCHDAKKVGPVRSARFDDPKIAKPYTKVLAFSGANGIVLLELEAQKMVTIEELTAPDALYRIPPGTLDVHNLFGSIPKLRKLPKVKKQEGPTSPFEFGRVPAGAKKARSVSINFTASNTIQYRWRKGAWRRFEAGVPFATQGGGQIAVANLLIQEVEVNRSESIVDVAGNPSPDIDLRGKGRALLFRDGKVIRGTWTSKKKGTLMVFETNHGDPFVFAEGAIWVELVPSNKGDVKGSFSFK